MRGRARAFRVGAIAASGVALAVLFLVVAGGTFRTPTTVGVVAERTDGPYPEIHYTFTDGRRAVIRVDDELIDGMGPPIAGDLLLAGDEPTPWFARLGPDESRTGCFVLVTSGTRRDDFVETRDGLRLPVAPHFDPAIESGNQVTYPGGSLCVDDQGRVRADAPPVVEQFSPPV